MSRMIKIRVPATSANLGPGFDCLGLALDIWNEVIFETGEGLNFRASGEGAEKLNKGNRNLLTKAYARVHQLCGKNMEGVSISSHNGILMSSGMGSSAAAIVAGVLGANEMLGNPLSQGELLKLAADLEGHPDNIAPALLGGLVISTKADDGFLWKRHEIPEWTVVVVKPQLEWTTKMARAVLPKSVSRADAIFNIGRSVLVVEALLNGDLEFLRKVMDDRIHQSYRLRHISGGMAAYKTAGRFGAAALSGAGPSIILFTVPDHVEDAKAQIASVFEERGIRAKSLVTKPVKTGAYRVES
ncbi:MAG: homoserine kinase [Anaerolineaceae bacterium]|nr:MAG: homoserine kinase [Chloroflexota bacterium]GJQ37095.1 MAG: homoserine kinase [Anaerolineaceae bacterium]